MKCYSDFYILQFVVRKNTEYPWMKTFIKRIRLKVGCISGKHNAPWPSEMCIKRCSEKFKIKKHFKIGEHLAYLDVAWNMSEIDVNEIRLEGIVSM